MYCEDTYYKNCVSSYYNLFIPIILEVAQYLLELFYSKLIMVNN